MSMNLTNNQMLYFIKIDALEKGWEVRCLYKDYYFFHEDYLIDFKEELKHYSVILILQFFGLSSKTSFAN